MGKAFFWCCLIFGVLFTGVTSMGQAPVAPQPAILGISQVTFRVKDLSKTIAFYNRLLGYEPNRSRQSNPSAAEVAFAVNDRQQLIFRAGLAAGQDERLVEVALEVQDAEAMRIFLRNKGIQVPETLKKEPGGVLTFVVNDPENHQIKFMQFPPAREAKNFGSNKSGPGVSDRVLHVGITVANVANVDAFYVNALGFSEIWRGGRPDNVTNWINMRVPDGTDYLEYMLVSGQVSRQQLGVLHHVALQVPSMQQALDVLRSRNLGPTPYTLEAPRIGRNNRWQLNLYDPDGTRIELMEPFPMR